MTTEVFGPFQELLSQVREASEKIAAYRRGGSEARPWMLPPPRGWNGDPLQVDQLEQPFERNRPNEDLQTALSHEDGVVADAMTAELQINYMSVMERSFRHRHMSSVRAAMHAAGRRVGHGDPAGVHIGGVLQYVQDMSGAGEEGGDETS